LNAPPPAHISPFYPHNTHTPCPTAAYSEEVGVDGAAAIEAEETEEVAAEGEEVGVEPTAAVTAELPPPKRSDPRRRTSWI
jgi:hypothetical protein